METYVRVPRTYWHATYMYVNDLNEWHLVGLSTIVFCLFCRCQNMSESSDKVFLSHVTNVVHKYAYLIRSTHSVSGLNDPP